MQVGLSPKAGITPRRAVFLVGLAAAAARTCFAYVQMTFGLQLLHYGPVFFISWNDFYSLYIPQLAFITKGVLPYAGFGYSYPPLFLYSLLPFYWLGGPILVAAAILATDALAAVVICLIVSGRKDSRFGLWAGLAYAFLPLALANEGYLWLSGQPMLLLALLAVFLFTRGRITSSMLVLGLAAMFRQEVIPMAIPLLFLAFRKEPAAAAKGFAAFAGAIALVSMPFLIIEPGSYLISVSYGLIRVGTLPPQPPLTPWDAIQFTGGNPPCLVLCQPSVNTVQVHWDMFIIKLGSVLRLVTLPLLGLAAFAIYLVRRSSATLPLVLATAVFVLLYFFAVTVHVVFTYYFLPFYALLICASSNRAMLVTNLIGSTVAAFVVGGDIQFTIALVTMLVCLAFADIGALPGQSQASGL